MALQRYRDLRQGYGLSFRSLIDGSMEFVIGTLATEEMSICSRWMFRSCVFVRHVPSQASDERFVKVKRFPWKHLQELALILTRKANGCTIYVARF